MPIIGRAGKEHTMKKLALLPPGRWSIQFECMLGAAGAASPGRAEERFGPVLVVSLLKVSPSPYPWLPLLGKKNVRYLRILTCQLISKTGMDLEIWPLLNLGMPRAMRIQGQGSPALYRLGMPTNQRL